MPQFSLVNGFDEGTRENMYIPNIPVLKNEMEAMAACTKDDVLFRNWLIRFVNSQMLLKGCETQGHLILSAAKTEILSQIHMPVWKDQTLTSKTSWSGSLDSMQYFATVIPEDSTQNNGDIYVPNY